jgi:hypothetical protein
MEPKEFSPEWFDQSSKAWKENKRVKGKYDRTFAYICQHQHKNGKLCKRGVFWSLGNIELLCKYHFFDYQKQKRHKASVTNQVEECSPDLP